MARTANVFHDPAGARADYPWPVNHSEEESFGIRRNVEHTAPTSGQGASAGLVRQQGEDSPMVLKLSGTIFHAAQHAAMQAWAALSRTQTIHFYDFAGDRYEVLILAFESQRKRTLRNPRDASVPLHYWTYTLELEVVRVLAGAWA